MFFTYVLYSPEHKKIYIGYTSDLGQRILSHNDARSKGWTRSFQPWKLVYSESFDTRQEAMRREKSLKTGGGRRFIHDEIISKLEL
jgi:putative endonuclease